MANLSDHIIASHTFEGEDVRLEEFKDALRLCADARRLMQYLAEDLAGPEMEVAS